MKKWLIAFLLSSIVISLVGCTAEKTNKEVKEEKVEKNAKLKVSSKGSSEKEWELYVANEFTKKTGIPVEIIPASKDFSEDIFSIEQSQIELFEEKNLLLSNPFKKEYEKDFFLQTIEAVSGKNMYGYPLSVDTYTLIYNKKLVENIPQTMEEMLEIAEKYSNKKEKTYGFMMEVNNTHYINSFIEGYGKDGKEETKKLMKEIRKEILPLSSEEITKELKDRLFKEDRLMFQIEQISMIETYKKQGFDIGYMSIPELKNGKMPKPYLKVDAYYVNSKTKYPKAASEFAKFATSDEMLLKRKELTGKIPAKKTLTTDESILQQIEHSIPYPNNKKIFYEQEKLKEEFLTIWDEE